MSIRTLGLSIFQAGMVPLKNSEKNWIVKSLTTIYRAPLGSILFCILIIAQFLCLFYGVLFVQNAEKSKARFVSNTATLHLFPEIHANIPSVFSILTSVDCKECVLSDVMWIPNDYMGDFLSPCQLLALWHFSLLILHPMWSADCPGLTKKSQ